MVEVEERTSRHAIYGPPDNIPRLGEGLSHAKGGLRGESAQVSLNALIASWRFNDGAASGSIAYRRHGAACVTCKGSTPLSALLQGINMHSNPSIVLLSFIVLTASLAGCQRNEPPPAVVAVPGPAGEPGAAGATGATGQTGPAGANTTVIVPTPPASAAST